MNTKASRQEAASPDSELQAFTSLLRGAGLRVTPERLALREVMRSGRGKYFSVRSLVKSLEEGGSPVNTATVYNGIRAFERLGLLRKRRRSSDGSWTYAYTAPSTRVADKLGVDLAIECKVCGKVKVVRDSPLTNYLRRHRFTGFDTSRGVVSIHISCECTRCSRSAKGNEQNNNIHS